MSPAVLIVMDDIFLRPRIESQVTRAGYGVVGKGKHPDLPSAVAATKPRAIVVSLQSTSFDVFASIQRLRADPANQGLAVLGFCQHERSDLADRGRAAGCDQVVTNGYVSQQLGPWLAALGPGSTAPA